MGSGMFFYVERILNYGGIRSGGVVYDGFGVRKHFLSITNDLERNYSVSLR